MKRLVISCYRPKAGCESALDALMVTHVDRLRAAGLLTDRESVLMRSADGTVVEVFEWKSTEAIEAAHSHPAVLAMWEEYAAVCEYVPIAQVPEAAELFSEFDPI